MRPYRISQRLGIIIRILLILALGFSAILIFTLTPYWLVGGWLGIIMVLLVAELIRYLERSYKVFGNFLQLIRHDDFTTHSKIDPENREFQDIYRFILDKYRNLRIEKERNYHYLKQVIEHVNIALLCLRDEHGIALLNKAAMELLQVPEIKDLRALEKVDRELVLLIQRIRTGEKKLIRFIRHGRMMKLSVRATEFTLEGQLYKIVSLHDIQSELEEQELESWQKLVRILTHEIMNSTIPITNMISMARKILFQEDGGRREMNDLSEEEMEDLVESLTTAESRSKGLSSFVLATQSLSRIPEPTFDDIPVRELFNRIHKIFQTCPGSGSVRMNMELSPEDLTLKADADLIEQVMINLIRNALDALDGVKDAMIRLKGFRTLEGTVTIEICDNGHGISGEHLDQIFIPFFCRSSSHKVFPKLTWPRYAVAPCLAASMTIFFCSGVSD